MSYEYDWDGCTGYTELVNLKLKNENLKKVLIEAYNVVLQEEREWSRHDYRYIKGTPNPYTKLSEKIKEALLT